MRKIKKLFTVIGMVGLITGIGLIYTGCAGEKQAEEESIKKESRVETVQDTTVQDTAAVDTTQ
ncbi:MAG: hypothetical protein R6V04_14700 [bacterium]